MMSHNKMLPESRHRRMASQPPLAVAVENPMLTLMAQMAWIQLCNQTCINHLLVTLAHRAAPLMKFRFLRQALPLIELHCLRRDTVVLIQSCRTRTAGLNSGAHRSVHWHTHFGNQTAQVHATGISPNKAARVSRFHFF